MSKTAQEARESLMRALPYFRHAIDEAAKNGIVKLGILAEKPDGSGKLEMKFECEEFFNDIALVLGAPDQTEDDKTKAKALAFLQKHRLTVSHGDGE